jgi:hypothetical protein
MKIRILILTILAFGVLRWLASTYSFATGSEAETCVIPHALWAGRE